MTVFWLVAKSFSTGEIVAANRDLFCRIILCRALIADLDMDKDSTISIKVSREAPFPLLGLTLE
jgi:hypothetical protein